MISITIPIMNLASYLCFKCQLLIPVAKLFSQNRAR